MLILFLLYISVNLFGLLFPLGLMTELDLDLTHADEIPPGTERCNNKRQPTLRQMQVSREKMSPGNLDIVLDEQPLSAVDDLRFQCLLCVLQPRYEIAIHYHTMDMLLPKLHNSEPHRMSLT